MSKAFVVARWEYLEKVKSKAFLIGLFVTPVLMIAMGILPGLFATREDEQTKVIGLIDLTGEMAAPFAERLQKNYELSNGAPNYLVEVLYTGTRGTPEQAIAGADAKVLAGDIEGYCIIRSVQPSDSLIEYRSKNVGDFRLGHRVEETMRSILLERKLASMGLDPSLTKELKIPLTLRTVQISTSGEMKESGFLRIFFTAYVFLMMLFFLIVTSGQLLVRSVIEEKSNRIVEILVSSCSPTELMGGKVLGLSGLGFTQIGFWSVIGIAASAQFGIELVDMTQAALLILYFILGYLFYAAVFIGVGSPVTTEQEAQQITSYLVIVLILPIALALPAIQNPGATWLKILSFVPPLTSTMMALRISVHMPSAMEIIGTILLMIVSIYAAMWAAGRIFKVAILATGKRPRLKEIIGWIRTG
jgi:ABC-2 type transport system permease protein